MQTKWCHSEFDYLQLDHRTMVNYSDVGSKQHRYCGNKIPKEFVSETNVLIIDIKTNSDSIRGKGFRLRWEAVSGKYKHLALLSIDSFGIILRKLHFAAESTVGV